MRTYAAEFFLSVFLVIVLTPLVKRVAWWVGAIDHPDERKIHRGSIPRLGGLAIYIACVLPIPILYLLGSTFVASQVPKVFHTVAVMLGMATVMMLLGTFDDIRRLNAWVKLPVEILAAVVIIYYAGIRVQVLTHPLHVGDAMIVFSPLDVIITVLWIVGVTNAINFLDGIDGLAAGVCVFVSLTICTVAVINKQLVAALLAVPLAGASLGFLRYNFNPATIFMGDSGSLFLGFSIAVLSLYANQKATTAIAILVPVVVLGVPLWDALLAVSRRVRARRSVFDADREHIHHRLLRFGMGQRKAALFLYALTAVLCLAAIGITVLTRRESIIILIILGSSVYFLSHWLGLSELGLGAIHAASRVASRLRTCKSRDELRQILREGMARLDVQHLTVSAAGSDWDLDISWENGGAGHLEGASLRDVELSVPAGEGRTVMVRALMVPSSDQMAALGIISSAIAAAIVRADGSTETVSGGEVRADQKTAPNE